MAGVSDEVIEIVGALYSKDDAYMQSLDKNAVALAKISGDRYVARRLRKILREGLDLNDDEYAAIQIETFRASLTALGITSPDEVDYIFGLIPRI